MCNLLNVFRMKKRKIHHSVNSKLNSEAFKYDIPTHEDDPKLPGVFVFCGSRGSGKTYACIAMVKHFERLEYITRTFLLCPTSTSNTLYSNLTTLEKSDTCEDERYFQLFLQNILKEVKKDWKAFEGYKKYVKLYSRYRQGDPFLSLSEMAELEKHGYGPPKRMEKPSHLLIVDDAQGTDLYTTCRKDLMSHMTIKHRHIPIMLCFLMQSWTGLPRVIRLNATHFMLFKTGDAKQLEQIYSAFGNLVSWDDFLVMYKDAVAKPHGFLYIDTNPKSEEKRFRDGFNNYFLTNKSV